MSLFTGRREPETKERMQGILDLASFLEGGVSSLLTLLERFQGKGEGKYLVKSTTV